MITKTFLPTLLAAGSMLLSCPLAFAQSAADEADVIRLDARHSNGQYRPNEVIVKFTETSRAQMMQSPQGLTRSGVRAVDEVLRSLGVKRVEALMPLTGAERFQRKTRSFNGTEVATPSLANAYVMEIDSKHSVREAVKALEAVGDVEYAEPNYLVHALAAPEEQLNINDPLYNVQFGIAAINLYGLWTKPIINDTPPVIAILDTGVDIYHPDLKGNIWTNKRETAGVEGYDDDNNGYTDDLHGYDFVNQTGMLADYNGHGTHCAGIAAAKGFNGIGIIGANPNAKIMSLVVMQSNGTGDVATIIKAVDYAAANGAQVISMSLGTYAHSVAFKQALGRAYQKSVLVAAAGNDGMCLNHAHPEKGQAYPMPMFPAAYNFVLGVQAGKTTAGLADFSNYDDDGPVFTGYGEEELYNYELVAPGVGIMSTYPNGQYKRLNGSSMATPLVAGAISRLLQSKEYGNKEELFGDLINSKTLLGNLDILAAYRLTDADRKPELQMVSAELVDSLYGSDGDGKPDAGETVEFYPILRNSWGTAKNIKVRIECAEPVNNFAEILTPEIDFGSTLHSYAKNKAKTPLKVRFKDNVVDGRICRLKLIATADNAPTLEQEFEVVAENGVELGGVIKEDMTLHAGVHYIVTKTLAVPDGRTLTIEPGTVIKFKDKTGLRVSSGGHLIAEGKPGKMITFTKADLLYNVNVYLSISDTLKYCVIENLDVNGGLFLNDCLVQYSDLCYDESGNTFFHMQKTNMSNMSAAGYFLGSVKNSNVIASTNNLPYTSKADDFFCVTQINSSNVFSNRYVSFLGENHYSCDAAIGCYSDTPLFYTSPTPNYLGTGRDDLARKRVLDINNTADGNYISYAEYDFSNMPTRPIAEAHGIVWKVVVDGYDAQDQFEELPPLGVGKHKFEVYFNRPMNKNKIPMVAMGVRPPYTQQVIAEDGSWNEAGDVYTAYFTITGKQNIDGLTRIYVAGAEDDEFFEIPEEKCRFNVNVQAAGSLSTGFFAEAGLGRVNLSWQDLDLNFEDIMGYNMYRINPEEEHFVYDVFGNKIWDYEKGDYKTEWRNDTILLNKTLIEAGDTTYTDYDVVPGKTYQYYYKVMTTALKENDPSKIIAVTPLTATKGDANGSGQVDVADVLSTVNYASGMTPKPFIFEAADMNVDQDIDIVDVVGIINVIVGRPDQASAKSMAEATLTVEDGVLYIDSPVEFAGVQFDLRTSRDQRIETLEALNGFETTGAWQSEDTYRFLAYNLNGKTIAAGKHALLRIGQASVTDARMSDPMGTNIEVLFDSQTGIAVTDMDRNKVKHALPGVYNILGVKVGNCAADLDRLPAGIYIVNGWKVRK